MTRSQLLQLAREVGVGDSHGYFAANYADQLERFDALVPAIQKALSEMKLEGDV